MPELAENENYYYADGERVTLVPSRQFLAVRADEEQVNTLSARAGAASPDPQQPVNVLRIPDHDLVVLKMDGTEGAAAAAGAFAMADTAGDTSAVGPPVYETVTEGHEDSPTGLVDVGELIVKLAPGGNSAALLKKHHLAVVTEDYPEPGASLVRTTREQDSGVAIANELHEQDGVEFAIPNFVRLSPRLHSVEEAAQVTDMPEEAGPSYTPNDPLLSSQWGIAKIRCPEPWNISRGSSAISVAVIDEGGNAHEDYSLAPGYDARFNDNNPTPNSSDGHGVACAGIVAARANNGRGIAGVAPNSRVRHIRIAYGIGGGFWSTTDAVIAAGVRRAVDLGADVLSNSWGSGASTVVTNAFRYASTNGRGGKGTPIAAATGNGDVLGVGYPARLSPQIRGFLAVGASNQWDQRKSKTSLDGETWWGSNYGPQVDVVAPGVKIPTTDIMGAGGYSSGNYVTTFNGTSSATPHVAGLMALILAVDPGLRSWEVEDIIKLSAKGLGASGRDDHFGFGRIDARAALEATSRIWSQTRVTPVFLGSGRDAYLRVRIRIFNPGINTVRLNNLRFRSMAPDGSVRDEFVFQGNPGPVLSARSGHDVTFTNLLLRANGNSSRWSYRWSINWGYTYWRPSSPALPLSAAEFRVEEAVALDESQGLAEVGATVEGDDEGGSGDSTTVDDMGVGETAATTDGDSVTIDRATKGITICVR